MMHWLETVTGINAPGSPWYNFWSGIGSDIGELAIISVVYRKLNCHQKGCYRLGLHHYKNGLYIFCRKHHPEIK